jgi:hypothetical protein
VATPNLVEWIAMNIHVSVSESYLVITVSPSQALINSFIAFRLYLMFSQETYREMMFIIFEVHSVSLTLPAMPKTSKRGQKPYIMLIGKQPTSVSYGSWMTSLDRLG